MEIPHKTMQEILATPIVGDRHAQMIRIAMSLIGNGFSQTMVFTTLREKYPADKTDKEIQDVIAYCVTCSPKPTVFNGSAASPLIPNKNASTAIHNTKDEPLTPELMERNALKLTSGVVVTEKALKLMSPIGAVCSEINAMLIHLYAEDENINLVSQFTRMTNASGKEKANPVGSGTTRPRNEWMDIFSKRASEGKGIPGSEAGAWMRPNPVKLVGSGKGGAIKDDDVTACRFVLLESDILSPELQLSLLCKLRLPIAVILKSGGASYHAWVKVDSKTLDDYQMVTESIFRQCAPLGIDRANKNPSRLSRLAGSKRTIGASGDGMQSLIYLNPKPTHQSIC